jgi:RNA polymerase sigma-70 factor, ECF subfamily
MPKAHDGAASESWDWAEARRICLRAARRHAKADDAEDIAQEALARAWRHRSKLQDNESLVGWLTTIVRNEASRELGRRRPTPFAEVIGSEAVEEESARLLDVRLELDDAIARLEGPDRLLIGLRYRRDLTQPAIARLLNLPEGTVKIRLHRARAKLHRALSEP